MIHDVSDAGAESVAAGQQRGPRRRARRIGIGMGEPHAVERQRVDRRRKRPREIVALAVHADFVIADVVGDDDHDVSAQTRPSRFKLLRCGQGRQTGGSQD